MHVTQDVCPGIRNYDIIPIQPSDRTIDNIRPKTQHDDFISSDKMIEEITLAGLDVYLHKRLSAGAHSIFTTCEENENTLVEVVNPFSHKRIIDSSRIILVSHSPTYHKSL
jgi:hypothetical protein